MSQHCDVESAEFRRNVESDLIYLGTFGLDDPIRPNVWETVNMIKYGNKEGKKGLPDKDKNDVSIKQN